MPIIPSLISFFNFKKMFTNMSLGNILIIIFISLIAILVIPNFNQIKEKLGFETRTSLKVKLSEAIGQKVEAIEANNQLVETIDELTETSEHKDEAVLELVKLEKDIKTSTNQILAKKNKRIQDIKDDEKPKPNPVPTVLVNDETNDKSDNDVINERILTEIEQRHQEEAISLVQIESIWEAFCKFNNSPECQKGVS